MIAGILQPGYLPWLGFFEQLSRSDVFVLYDDVQYDKNGWRNRNRIKNSGGPLWLTVPVFAEHSSRAAINEVRIDNSSDWKRKHLLSIRQSYTRAPFFKDYIGLLEEVYDRPWEKLADLDIHLIRRLAEVLGLGRKRILLASSLGVSGKRVERLIRICQHVGADVFYEGAAGRDYLRPEDFSAQGIRLEFQDYRHPVYPQLHGKFVPYLSVVDLLFNCGPRSLDILTGNAMGERT